MVLLVDHGPFSIQADDGETLNHRSNVVTGTVNFTNVNDAPVISYASLGILQGGTVVLGPSDFHVTHTDNLMDFSGFETRPDLPSFAGSFTLVSADMIVSNPLVWFGNSITIGINDLNEASPNRAPVSADRAAKKRLSRYTPDDAGQ